MVREAKQEICYLYFFEDKSAIAEEYNGNLESKIIRFFQCNMVNSNVNKWNHSFVQT